MNDIDRIRAKFGLDECALTLSSEIFNNRLNELTAWGNATSLEIAAERMANEIATLRAELEVCTAYANICAEDLDLPEETTKEFWQRFEAARDAFYAACGVTPTPDDIPEEG